MNKEEFNNFKNNCVRVQGLEENDVLKEYYLWKISECKRQLETTDYKAIKYAEGYYTDEEYAQIKFDRQSYRDEINQYEQEIEKLGV